VMRWGMEFAMCTLGHVSTPTELVDQRAWLCLA
jgi:hypothetical protein